MQLEFKKLNDGATLPTRGSSSAAGLDLYASRAAAVPARSFTTVHTDIAVCVPENYYGRVAPRSGLAAKHGIGTMAGVIDSDYRGELLIILSNLSDQDFEINPGDRIAQLVIEAIAMPDPVWADELGSTARADGGLGSTGTN